jgi:hypothetical protein
MIDLEVTRNYISLEYMARHRLETREKKHIYKLTLVDGKLIR